MNFQDFARDLVPQWKVLLLLGIRVVFIAIVFEFLAWWAGRRVEKMAEPFITLDQARDPKWRATRRATLRGVPKLISRTLLYTVAGLLVFDVLGVPVLPLSLAVGAVAALIGSALLPTFRDYTQGYSLLAEDTLAPGDVVSINGHIGKVEKWTLRATWLKDGEGRLHTIPNRDVRTVIHVEKSAGEPLNRTAAFDPLATVPGAGATGTPPATGATPRQQAKTPPRTV